MRDRDTPTVQTVEAADARQHWGEVLSAVSRKEARVVVEQDGQPVAALVSIDDLVRLTTLDRESASVRHPALSQEEIDAALAANRARAETTRALLAPPSPEELARRQAVAARIRANRPYRVIAPLTTADLIHEARAQEEEAYGQPR